MCGVVYIRMLASIKMKKIFTLCLFSLLSFPLFSQYINSEIGIEVGPSITKLDSKPYDKHYHLVRIGYYIGLSYQYNFSKNISLRTGLAFEQKGFSSNNFRSFPDTNGILINEWYRIKETFSYMTLPVLFRYNFGKKKYFINAGPYVGFLLSHKYEREKGIKFPAQTEQGTNGFNKIDFGISAGAGFNFPIRSNLKGSLEIRHNAGLYSVLDSTKAAYYGTSFGPFTSATNLLIGLTLRLAPRSQ